MEFLGTILEKLVHPNLGPDLEEVHLTATSSHRMQFDPVATPSRMHLIRNPIRRLGLEVPQAQEELPHPLEKDALDLKEEAQSFLEDPELKDGVCGDYTGETGSPEPWP
nr:uncharacterized protein LOC122322311 [Drosophila bipectinata]